MTNTTKSKPAAPAPHTRIAVAGGVLTLLDESGSNESQGYRLVRVYRLEVGGETFKIRSEVRWDSVARQSFAQASVLADDLRWTHLVGLPTEEWHAGAASAYAPVKPVPAAELGWIVTDLVTRAATILA